MSRPRLLKNNSRPETIHSSFTRSRKQYERGWSRTPASLLAPVQCFVVTPIMIWKYALTRQLMNDVAKGHECKSTRLSHAAQRVYHIHFSATATAARKRWQRRPNRRQLHGWQRSNPLREGGGSGVRWTRRLPCSCSRNGFGPRIETR